MTKFGLDFGTTNSSISIFKDGESLVVPIDEIAQDPRVIRSMLYFGRREMVFDPKIPPERIKNQVFKMGEISYMGNQSYEIGQKAVNIYLSENKNRSSGIKRTIYTGKFIDTGSASEDQARPDLVAQYYEEIDYGTGRLLQALKSTLKTPFKGTTVFGTFMSVEELISLFIKRIKTEAEKQIGENISSVKVGRPVHFSDSDVVDKRAQERLETALRLAGFTEIEFEFEPVAAAKQFISKSKNLSSSKKIFVFDFGGGTLDTAIVEIGKENKVLATDGVYIGGDLLNADLMQNILWPYFGSQNLWGINQNPMPRYIYDSLNSWYSIPNLNNPETMGLLEDLKYKNSNPEALNRLIYLIKTNVGFEIYEAIEKAKKQLSTEIEANIIYTDGLIDINIKITRSEFEEIIERRVEEIDQVIINTLKSANLNSGDIDMVVRTGGSSLIPVFENLLIKHFGRDKITLFETFTSIAAGLAI